MLYKASSILTTCQALAALKAQSPTSPSTHLVSSLIAVGEESIMASFLNDLHAYPADTFDIHILATCPSLWVDRFYLNYLWNYPANFMYNHRPQGPQYVPSPEEDGHKVSVANAQGNEIGRFPSLAAAASHFGYAESLLKSKTRMLHDQFQFTDRFPAKPKTKAQPKAQRSKVRTYL